MMSSFAPESRRIGVPKKALIDGVYYLNPGSVSIPKEASPHSSLIYDGEFHWMNIDSGNEYQL